MLLVFLFTIILTAIGCSSAKVFYYEYIRFDHFVRFVRSLACRFLFIDEMFFSGWIKRTVIWFFQCLKIQYLFRSIKYYFFCVVLNPFYSAVIMMWCVQVLLSRHSEHAHAQCTSTYWWSYRIECSLSVLFFLVVHHSLRSMHRVLASLNVTDSMTISISFQCSRIKIWLYCLRFVWKSPIIILVSFESEVKDEISERIFCSLFTFQFNWTGKQTDPANDWRTHTDTHVFFIFLSTMIFSIPNNM